MAIYSYTLPVATVHCADKGQYARPWIRNRMRCKRFPGTDSAVHEKPTEPSLTIQKQREYAIPKRKVSTFERLRSRTLNREEPKEFQRRWNATDPGLEVVHPG